MASTVYLLRHADSVPSPDVPESDWPLSEQGHAQAESLVTVLRPLGIDRVVTSPYRRAVQSVAPFARQHDVTLHSDDRLRERHLTDEWLDDHEAAVRATWADFEHAHPGGESSAACQRRVVQAVDAWTERFASDTLLFSSHGNALSVYLHHLDADVGFDDWAAMQKPDLFRIEEGAWERVDLNTVDV
jgi:2,3-bisphosphoglycerate-dependent phosphoglycerate mutase